MRRGESVMLNTGETMEEFTMRVHHLVPVEIDYRPDVDLAKTLLARADAVKGRYAPCWTRSYGEACMPEHAHQTCPRCYCWIECSDPECEHPACGHMAVRLFFDAWEELHPDDKGDIVVAVSEPVPLIESMRLRERIEKENAEGDPVAGAKLLAAIQKTPGKWRRLYAADSRLGVPVDALGDALEWLAIQGAPVEHRSIRETSRTALAYNAALGSPIRGGSVSSEIRYTPANLDALPDLAQGALF